MIRVCIAGATGWVGRSLVPAVLATSDLDLTGAVSRSWQGKDLGEALSLSKAKLRISGTVEEALAAGADVLVDYTHPGIVKPNVMQAVNRGVHVVIGTSGLTDMDYQEIDDAATKNGVGVLAAGNFAISAVLLQHFALVAAKFIPSWEVIDYAHADKVDAPSGMTRELAYRLSKVRAPETHLPISQTTGSQESRGAEWSGTQIHSVRLPGYVIAAEVLFGKPSEKLTLRYEAGTGAEPYVEGTLLAVRRVSSLVGLCRGLDHVLNLE